jgi:hypothetical protein
MTSARLPAALLGSEVRARRVVPHRAKTVRLPDVMAASTGERLGEAVACHLYCHFCGQQLA